MRAPTLVGALLYHKNFVFKIRKETHMQLEIDVTMEKSDLYDYRLYRIYTSLVGILVTMAGILLVADFFISGGQYKLMLGSLMIIVLPIAMSVIVKNEINANSSLTESIKYQMSDDKIIRNYNAFNQEEVLWSDIKKAVSTRNSFFLVASDQRVIIFPRREIMNNIAEVIGMISTHIPPQKVNIKL